MMSWWLVSALTAVVFLVLLPWLARARPRQALEASDAIAAFVSRIGKLAAWLAVVMMVVILFDVVTRQIKSSDWVTGSPALARFFQNLDAYASSTKLQELEWHLHGALFLLCFGYAYVKDAHVRIELVRDRCGVRTRAAIELVGIVLFMLPYTFLLIDFGHGFAERSFVQGEASAAMTGLSQRWIIKSFIPIGFVLYVAAAVSIYLKCVVHLVGPPELRARAGAYLAPQATHIVVDA